MQEEIKKAFDTKFEEIGEDIWHDIGNDKIFEFGWNACLASQAQQENRSILVGEVNNKYGDPEAFAERSYYIDEQVLQAVPIGYKLVAIPPAPEGDENATNHK